MSALQDQDVDTFSSPMNTKNATQEARSSDRLKRSVEGSDDDVINALQLLWKLQKMTSTEEWANIIMKTQQLHTPAGINIYVKVAKKLRDTAALLEARSSPYEQKHVSVGPPSPLIPMDVGGDRPAGLVSSAVDSPSSSKACVDCRVQDSVPTMGTKNNNKKTRARTKYVGDSDR
jgi:hypothetical protein